MLLALIVFQLSVLVATNPFHKYPFVFLLDVGNEELEKNNSEQIRISMPGGSAALRYPAIGDGDTIGHIRVSGIDFGTNLKANIVDGGPGYKYVVLVFMGNPGVPYDAVLTVQTLADQTLNIPNIGNVLNSDSNTDQVIEDANNSAEDMSEDSVVNDSHSETYMQSTNAKLLQSSSNVYNYAQNEIMDQRDDFDGDTSPDNNNGRPSNALYHEEQGNDNSENSFDETESGQKDIHNEYRDYVEQINDPDIQVKKIDTDDENDNDNEEEISPELAQSVPSDYEEDNEPIRDIGVSGNSNYNSFRPYLNGGEVYNEDNKQTYNRPVHQQEPLDYEDPDEIQPFFNDGEVHNSAVKYKDSNNNNYIDSDDSSAVAY